ncbi:MAG TPA: exopolysaccharide biosynthesis protein [Pseudonocardiaceae bacterium]|nr:exopolysaccharide biosynthesis protein [Pseudonocardiaceae bacterium]
MTATSTPTPEPLLDLQRLGVTMRRSRKAWLSAGLVGLLAGVAFAVLIPAPPTAVTRLLVVHEGDHQGPTDPSRILTDIALIKTARIAGLALQRIGSTDRPEDFMADYEATALTTNVLELEVKGSDDLDAQARAQALADAFIADHVQRAQAAAQADAKTLLDRRAKAQEELDQVNAAIDGMTAADRRNRQAELEQLFARRGELTTQIAELTNRAEDAGPGAPRVAAGTQIVDAPRVKPRGMLSAAALSGGIGFLLALAAGLSLAAVSGVVRDRPVLRRELAEHLGASVIAQLREQPRWSARLPSWLARRRRRVAATLARAVGATDGPVSLLELGTRRTTAALALDMAAELGRNGNVVVVDGLTHGRLGKRLGASDGPVRVVDASTRDAGQPPAGRPERRIGVGSVRPGTAWTDLPLLGAETLLVVRAGHASTLWLHTVARQLADLEIPVIGVVLVDPDRKDRSDGTLWDGLHTALRGRAGFAGSAPAPAEPGRKTPGVTTGRPAAKTPEAPNRQANGANAANTDGYPTEVLPIWPATEEIEGMTDVPPQRPRRRHPFGS